MNGAGRALATNLVANSLGASLIDGNRVRPTDGIEIEVEYPGDGSVLGSAPTAGASTVDAAVRSADAAFREWSRRTATERGRVLRRAGEILRGRRDELAAVEVLDTGKPIAEAREVDVDSAADCLDFFGGVIAGFSGTQQQLGSLVCLTRREPLGVCVGIGAWNYPLQIAAWKAAPALAAGNTMVFKPSELTPLSAVILAEILIEAGLPHGAFNVVQGSGATGGALIRHPLVRKVSLTGSVPTGVAIMREAAADLTHVTLELGGKSPLIVFADADLDDAVSGALLANFYTQGEICSNGTRVFVDTAVADEFAARLIRRTEQLRIGDPFDPATQVGALISREHAQKVLGYIEAGRAAGARCVCGGSATTVPGLEGGHYVRPTIFDGCDDTMPIVTDEIFGPVLSLLRFASEDEALRRANATPFGLAAGVFTRDLARAHRVAGELEAGVCWVNTFNQTPVEVPFGGVKMSGFGRENGLAALEHYTELKTVMIETERLADPYPQ